MGRIDLRVFVVLPLLALGACGEETPPSPAPSLPASPSAQPSSAPAPPPIEPSPEDSVFVEEDEEPTEAPGDLSGEGQSYLDEAIGIELGALESAGGDQAKQRRAMLDKLPADPSKVLGALRTYSWWSPEAKTLYDKAVATQK